MDFRLGSLTTQLGKNVSFNDFDKDGDGVISEQEYNNALAEFGLDKVELSNVDANADKEVSNEEFKIWEQKIKMEEALQPYLTQVTKDFTGKKSQYAGEMTNALRDYLDVYAERCAAEGKNIDKLAEGFEASLPAMYQTYKDNILNNTPDAIKSRVIDSIIDTQCDIARSASKDALGEKELSIYVKQIGSTLDTAATSFVNGYKGDNLEADLAAYLKEYLNTNDKEKMATAISEYNKSTAAFGGYIDSSELADLKEVAIKLLSEAINNNIPVNINGSNYTKIDALTQKINGYTDAEKLMADVQSIIAGFNDKSIVESSRANAVAQADAEEFSAFASIKGSAYQVDASEIDYTTIDGYFENEEYSVKAKKTQGYLREQLEDKVRETLDNGIKKQMRAQINAMLIEKGISTDKLDTIFENVYNQSLNDTLSAEGMIETKNKTWFRRGSATCNIKEVVDTFIATFNTNIAKTMDEMNASQTDMNVADIDYTAAGKNANGRTITEQGVDLTQAYADDKVITKKGRGVDYYKSLAETMIENMKSQFLQKAKTMCAANGIEFDGAIFTTKFNNAKSTAVAKAVTGTGSSKSLILPTSTLDTRTLMDTFTQNFVKDYSEWVKKEKTEI